MNNGGNLSDYADFCILLYYEKKKRKERKHTEIKFYDYGYANMESNKKEKGINEKGGPNVILFCSIVFCLFPGVLCAKGQHGYGRNDPQVGD